MTVCRACGFHNEAAATFCGSCGAYLEWTGEGPRPEVGGGPVDDPTPAPAPAASAATPPPPLARPAPGGRAVLVPPAVYLEPSTFAADPGGEATVRLDAHNRSGVVDQFTAEVSGVPAAWVDVQPPVLSLFPDDRGSLVVRFRPPIASAPPAGAIAFRVIVRSAADPSVMATVDGVLELGAFIQLAVELTPHTSKGRLAGRHRITVRNEGNTPVAAVLTGKDPDNVLGFRLRPDVVRAEPGTHGDADLRAKPRKRIWFGTVKWHRFQVMVAGPEGTEPVAVDAVMEQNKIIPTWVPRAAIGLLVMGGGALLLRSTVFKPKTEPVSAAQTSTVPAAALTTSPPLTSATSAVGGGTTTTHATLNTVVQTSSTTATPTTLPKVVFTSFRGADGEQIWTMNNNGSAAAKITSGGTSNSLAAWSPDRKQIAFVSQRDGNREIYVMNANGTDPRRLTNDGRDDLDPRWSPDGKKIVFASNRLPLAPTNFEIFVVNADGSGPPPVNLSNSPATADRKPAWSPDGSKIAFERGPQIVIAPSGGGPATPLVAGQHPTWSPDGATIAFSNGMNIFTIAATGGGLPTQLTNSAGNKEPWWAPDGRIVFTSGRDGNDEIYIMGANGSTQINLTNNGGGLPQNQDQSPQL